jgi:hypothetical protein
MGRTLLLIVVVVACVAGGCSTVIVPPPAPRGDTAPVLVADYGYHSTLILPRAQGGLIEYAFGDWTYFGQNQKSIGTALHALLMSDQATLGRRTLDLDPDDESSLADATGAKSVLRFEASRARVAELERALDERFSTRLDSITYSPVHHLYFVKDDERYGVANNCNHFTARGLERLGCRVEGVVMMSGFRVKEAGAATTRPTTRPAGSAQSLVRHGAGNS